MHTSSAKKKSKTKSGLSTSLRFSIAQHSRDLLLLESFVNFFGGGFVMNYKNRLLCEFIITKIIALAPHPSDQEPQHNMVEHIISFFDKHPILGSRHLNFWDFKSAAYIIKNKEHLNEDGLGTLAPAEEKTLQLKRRITSLYSNKAMNNHSVVYGTEKSDQKR